MWILRRFLGEYKPDNTKATCSAAMLQNFKFVWIRHCPVPICMHICCLEKTYWWRFNQKSNIHSKNNALNRISIFFYGLCITFRCRENKKVLWIDEKILFKVTNDTKTALNSFPLFSGSFSAIFRFFYFMSWQPCSRPHPQYTFAIPVVGGGDNKDAGKDIFGTCLLGASRKGLKCV